MLLSKLSFGMLLTFLVLWAAPVAIAQTSNHGNVRDALTVLNRVVSHTQRLIDAGNFARLPHEDGEFQEGVEALEKAIAAYRGDRRAKLESLIRDAAARSSNLARSSGTADGQALNSAHDDLAESVRVLIAAFPEKEQPAGTIPPRTD